MFVTDTDYENTLLNEQSAFIYGLVLLVKFMVYNTLKVINKHQEETSCGTNFKRSCL